MVHPCQLHQDIVSVLHDCETMTWSQIEQAAEQHKGSGTSIATVDLIPLARERLGLLGIEEEFLFELRVDHVRRIWGVRDRLVLDLLWWDPGHEVCRSKRHPSAIRRRAVPIHNVCPFGQSGGAGRCAVCFTRDL